MKKKKKLLERKQRKFESIQLITTRDKFESGLDRYATGIFDRVRIVVSFIIHRINFCKISTSIRTCRWNKAKKFVNN